MINKLFRRKSALVPPKSPKDPDHAQIIFMFFAICFVALFGIAVIDQQYRPLLVAIISHAIALSLGYLIPR